jgi:hypothetical protein
MSRYADKFFCLALLPLALAFQSAGKYPRLAEAVARTKFVDVHAHPSLGHVDYREKDPYPTLEPPISRPYWVIRKERIAVFDSLEVEALRAIYGYKGEDVVEDNLPELSALSRDFWKAGSRAGLDRVLDICAIELVLANSESPPADVDRARVGWVPFVDSFLFPFEPSALKAVGPRLRKSLASSHREIEETAQRYKRPLEDLSSYLDFVDGVLADYKRQGAVALKVASAYFRTLWFDDPDREDVASIFAEGTAGRLDSWQKYKKVQDFVARHIFLQAGELDLPVHFHTGFGGDAGLRNLDSNPLNLESVLSDPRFDGTRFLLLHAGYPFWDKLKPLLEKRNVFVDFSAVDWMVFEDELVRILQDWLVYPGASEKIMFGSDAGAPVFFWIAARNSRRALYRALSGLIDRRIITEEKAVSIAGKIMRGNALRVHHLEKPGAGR